MSWDRITIKLTAKQLQAIESAIHYALIPGCEWNDCEDGSGVKAQVRDAERALEIIQAAIAANGGTT